LTTDGHDDVGESRRRKSLRAARLDFVSARCEKDDAIEAFIVCLRGLLQTGGEIRGGDGDVGNGRGVGVSDAAFDVAGVCLLLRVDDRRRTQEQCDH